MLDRPVKVAPKIREGGGGAPPTHVGLAVFCSKLAGLASILKITQIALILSLEAESHITEGESGDHHIGTSGHVLLKRAGMGLHYADSFPLCFLGRCGSFGPPLPLRNILYHNNYSH